MTNSTLLSIFGIDTRQLFFSDTALLYDADDHEPFAALQISNGKAKLRIGGDLPSSGQRIVIE